MAKKKAGGKLNQQVKRAGKRLGVKVSGGQFVGTGEVLVRQRGTKVHAGDNVEVGRDHTLYALKGGKVEFKVKQGENYVTVQEI